MNGDILTSDDHLTLESQFATAPATLGAQHCAPRRPRGHAGGLARAARAQRWSDGRFMSRRDDLEIWAAAYYEPYAKGGRARAATAERDELGRFTPRSAEEVTEIER